MSKQLTRRIKPGAPLKARLVLSLGWEVDRVELHTFPAAQAPPG